MIVNIINGVIQNIYGDNASNFVKTFPKEYIYVKFENAEIGDRIENNNLIKPSYFYAHEIDEEHILEFIKSFNEITDDLYYNISSRELYDEYVNSGKDYYYNNGVIEEYIPPITKDEKLKQLEDFIYNMKEEGVLFKDLPFKCDDLASSRINKIVTGITVGANPFPLTWITRNSEQGVMVFNTKEEFLEFYTAFSNYELQIQVKEATYKMQIELAETQEQLDAIIFE